MARFDDLGRARAAAAQEAFMTACRVLEAVSGALRPAARAEHERTIETAIREAAAANKFEKAAYVRAAGDAIRLGPLHS